MDKESYSWGGIGFLALFFLIVVAFLFNRNGCGNGWFGNSCGNCGGNWASGFATGVGVPGYGLGFEDYKAICNSEKQEIINSARTQYLVEEQANLTRANDTANSRMIAEKLISTHIRACAISWPRHSVKIWFWKISCIMTASLVKLINSWLLFPARC